MRNPISSAFSESSNAARTESFHHNPPNYLLQIERGRTQFPSRPIDSSEFLIGASDRCQLRLGGSQIPEIHSRITNDGGSVRIEAVAGVPPLCLNGKIVKQAELAEGDRLSIGSFEFSIQKQATSAEATRLTDTELLDSDLDGFDAADLESLSAEELVDLLERDQAMVDEFESRQQQGAMALLHAVEDRMHQHAPAAAYDVLLPMPTQDADSAGNGEEGLSEGLQQLLAQLTDLSEALEQRTDRISRREVGYADAVSQLMDAQDKLALQLEFIAGRLSAMNDGEQGSTPTRAIA